MFAKHKFKMIFEEEKIKISFFITSLMSYTRNEQMNWYKVLYLFKKPNVVRAHKQNKLMYERHWLI